MKELKESKENKPGKGKMQDLLVAAKISVKQIERREREREATGSRRQKSLVVLILCHREDEQQQRLSIRG